MIPLRAGELTATPGKPWFHKVSHGKVDIVATQQDMLAYSHAPDIGNRA
jgi:hypothetical protein